VPAPSFAVLSQEKLEHVLSVFVSGLCFPLLIENQRPFRVLVVILRIMEGVVPP